jgi:hypothetical protein
MHGSGQWPNAIKLKQLQAKLTNAVMSIIGPSILMVCKLRILSVASHESHMTITQMIITLARAPTTSALWNPKEFFAVGFFYPIQIETILITKPPTSESICAASVKIANDPDKIPPAISTIINMKHITTTIASFLNALSPALSFA